MNLHFRIFLPALLSAVFCAASVAHAQTRVGEAEVIQNEVVRVAATTTQISVGDSMLRDETVRLFANGTLGPQPVGNTIHGGVGLRVNY
jgi:hypothetical protein